MFESIHLKISKLLVTEANIIAIVTSKEDNGADIMSTILPMTLPINKEDEECENAWIRNCIAINPGKRKLI